MSVTRPPTGDPQTPDQYEIRLAGHLHARWKASFDGFILTHEGNGTTVLRGAIVDQAALHGVLHKVRDLGVPLVSLTLLAAGPPNATEFKPADVVKREVSSVATHPDTHGGST